MPPPSFQYRVVVDTNVLFEGLTKRGGAADLIIHAWLDETIDVCVSTALAFEYADVLARKLSENRWRKLKPILGKLLNNARYTDIYFNWRPISPDPGDDHVIDCAMNANAIVVTDNVKDFRRAIKYLGLRVLTPAEFVKRLPRNGD